MLWPSPTLVSEAYPLICPGASSETSAPSSHALEPACWFSATIGLSAASAAVREVSVERANTPRMIILSLTLCGPSTAEHDGDGAEEDADVEPERRSLHVREIESVHVAEAEPAAAADLPEAGEARLHQKPQMHPCGVFGDRVRNIWARSHQA